jgi:hypothetical protein
MADQKSYFSDTEWSAIEHALADEQKPKRKTRRKTQGGTAPASPAASVEDVALDPERNIEAEREALARLAASDFGLFVERVKADAGFIFETDAVRALIKLQEKSRADFARLRARLEKEAKFRRFAALEAAMHAEAGTNKTNGDGLPGRPIRFDDIEPAPEPVNGAQMLTEIADTISAYVIMDEHQRDAAALGTVFAHTHDFRDVAPIFFIVSPAKRCGKTRLERVVKRAVPKPLMASGTSPAFLARVIEKHRPTVLIDEFDAAVKGDPAMAETLRGQLNSSFDRDGAKIGKCVPLPGGGYEEREFSTWAPTWIAGIKKIPETIEDRSIVLRLKRKLPGQKVRRLRGKDGGEFDILKRQIVRFVADNERRLREIEPQAPDALDAAGDRAADAWDPLFAIADVAGGAWPRRARAAALALSGADTTSLGESDVDVELLSDIAQVLDACDALGPTAEQLKTDKHIAVQALEAASRSDGQRDPRRVIGLGGEQLTNALATFIERRWPAWDKGKPMRPHQLARLLRAYGAVSQPLRDGDTVFRGYPRDRLDDAIGRYITRTPPNPGDLRRYNVTPVEKTEENAVFQNVTNDGCNTLRNAENPSNSGLCDGVTPKNGGVWGSGRSRPPKSTLSGQERVEAAECRGAEFVLETPTGFTWIYASGVNPTDPDLKLAEEAVNADRAAVEAFLRRRANGEAYEVLSPAPAGERCSLCGGGSPRPMRIRRGAHVEIWHEDCAAKYVATLAAPPTTPEQSESGEGPQKGGG